MFWHIWSWSLSLLWLEEKALLAFNNEQSCALAQTTKMAGIKLK